MLDFDVLTQDGTPSRLVQMLEFFILADDLKSVNRRNHLASGAVLKVSATDAGSQRDFRAFATLAGHALLHEEVDAGIYRYWLRKA